MYSVFISINSTANLLKIVWKVLLNMENQNMDCLFNNNKKMPLVYSLYVELCEIASYI